MARYPGAIWKPITANKGRRRMAAHNRVNLHVAVSEANSLHGYFNKSGIPDSHFYVRKGTKHQLANKLPATVEQYVDTAMRANADLEGNDATISVETQGGVSNAQGEPWDASQVLALAEIFAWCVQTHGIEAKLATDSKLGRTSRGLSWHRLGVDGNFPEKPSILAGRAQLGGGMRYSTARGKICPGDAKIRQIPGILELAVPKPKPKPAPTTPAGEIDETTMRRIHIQTTSKRKPQAIKKNVWTTIQINDKNDVSLLTTPGTFDAQLQLALKGVPKGSEVQVRFVLATTEPNGSKGKVSTKYPTMEIIGTNGGTFGNVTQKGVLPKPNPKSIRLRAQILVFNDGVTITSAQARTDVFPS